MSIQKFESFGVNEQLLLPGFETRDMNWYRVAANGGFLAVRAKFEDVEQKLQDKLDRPYINGQTYGESLDVKLAPGELSPDRVDHVSGTIEHIWDNQVKVGEDVFFIAHQIGPRPDEILRNFSLGSPQN